LLECDYSNLAGVASTAEQAGASFLHLDVMDGHFVPNLTFGPPVIRGFRHATPLGLDAHLMIEHPERFVEEYCKAGCNVVTIHVETTVDPLPVLREIRCLGCLAGLALKPETPVESIAPWLGEVDVVLPMTVSPGFYGQPFQEEVLGKFEWLRMHGPKDLILEADGGLNASTIPRVVAAGATLLVVGSALFRAANFTRAYVDLQQAANGAT
jgi:ribulose-phosphate 3-epimerase